MTNDVVLVTGASSGIGKDIALELASEGKHLVITARRAERLEELKKIITEKFFVKCLVLPCDLSRREELEKLIVETVNWSDRHNLSFNTLVNNAGSGVWDRFESIPIETAQRDIDVNITALTTLCYHFVHHLKSKKLKGSLLNIASMASFFPVANYAVYSATKVYVKQFSEALSYELKKDGISVTCVCPGGTKTEFVELAGQRLKGESGMMSSRDVARFSVKAMRKKKLIAVPGLFNKVSLLVKFLPNRLILPLVEKMMSLTVEKR